MRWVAYRLGDVHPHEVHGEFDVLEVSLCIIYRVSDHADITFRNFVQEVELEALLSVVCFYEVHAGSLYCC